MEAEVGVDYGDSAARIRALEKALDEHQLDEAGVLEELGKATRFCGITAKYHTEEADRMTLARCAYIAEAKRRTGLPYQGGKGSRGGTSVAGRGFLSWCRSNGISETHARMLAHVGASPDPAAALKAHRARFNKYSKDHTKRVRRLMEGDPAALPQVRNPVLCAKRAWLNMSMVQRLKFLGWLEGNTLSTPTPGARIIVPTLTRELEAAVETTGD